MSFQTTRWSLVVAAGGDDRSAAQAALATLCETYWYPLYAYVRRRGASADDARDLTQGFLTSLHPSEDTQPSLGGSPPRKAPSRSPYTGSGGSSRRNCDATSQKPSRIPRISTTRSGI